MHTPDKFARGLDEIIDTEWFGFTDGAAEV
jgi:hypothetical protein